MVSYDAGKIFCFSYFTLHIIYVELGENNTILLQWKRSWVIVVIKWSWLYFPYSLRIKLDWCVLNIYAVETAWLWSSQCIALCVHWPSGHITLYITMTHNGHDSVSNHQPYDGLLNRLFRRRAKKTSKLRVTGLCTGNSPGTGEFPAQMASNAENVSIWWRHHGNWDVIVWGRGLLDINFVTLWSMMLVGITNAPFSLPTWHFSND